MEICQNEWIGYRIAERIGCIFLCSFQRIFFRFCMSISIIKWYVPCLLKFHIYSSISSRGRFFHCLLRALCTSTPTIFTGGSGGIDAHCTFLTKAKVLFQYSIAFFGQFRKINNETLDEKYKPYQQFVEKHASSKQCIQLICSIYTA